MVKKFSFNDESFGGARKEETPKHDSLDFTKLLIYCKTSTRVQLFIILSMAICNTIPG